MPVHCWKTSSAPESPLPRQEDLVAAWEVVRDSFGDHDVPSTLMGVTVLGYKDQLVEIEAVAAVLDA